MYQWLMAISSQNGRVLDDLIHCDYKYLKIHTKPRYLLKRHENTEPNKDLCMKVALIFFLTFY